MFRSPAPCSSGRRRKLPFLRAALAGALCLSLMATPTARVEAQGGALPMIRDAEIEAILREEANPIFIAAGLKPEDVSLYLVGMNELQAMVTGGQNLLLFTGLIVRTENPNQLLGVIAHETGHIASGHLARQNEAMRSAKAARLVTLGLGILAALAEPSAAAGMFYSADYFGALQMISYTRVQEGAADQAAAKYLEKAGMSGKGLVDFFAKLRAQDVFSNIRKYPFLVDHPLTGDRIESLTQRVTTAAHYGAVDSPEMLEKHKIMIAKLKGFMNYPQVTRQDYPETDTSFPARYARAIAQYKDLNTDEAIKEIDALIADYPKNPYLYELKGQVLFESNRMEAAEEPYRRAVELAPDQPLIRVSFGQTLLALKKEGALEEAVKELEIAMRADRENPMGWRLLAEAYEREGDAGMARLATAEQAFHLGQLQPARQFGMRARELLPPNTPQFRRANDIINAAESNIPRRVRGG